MLRAMTSSKIENEIKIKEKKHKSKSYAIWWNGVTPHPHVCVLSERKIYADRVYDYVFYDDNKQTLEQVTQIRYF